MARSAHMPYQMAFLGWDMRYTLCLALLSLTVLIGGCSRGQDDRDGQYVTDADGRHFHPRIPFQNSEITGEAQELLDDVVEKHRADGVIQSIKIETARVDAACTGILNGNFSFSGRATVTVAGVAPFTVAFRERVTGSLVAGNNRLLDHWFSPTPRRGCTLRLMCPGWTRGVRLSPRKQMQTTWAIASRRPSPFTNS
jgi:hypothetical protein